MVHEVPQDVVARTECIANVGRQVGHGLDEGKDLIRVRIGLVGVDEPECKPVPLGGGVWRPEGMVGAV